MALSLALTLGAGALWAVATPGPLDRFGTLKGSDFAQFYVAARLAATSRLHELYNWPVFAAELTTAVPGPGGLLYLSVYPPQLAMLLSVLGPLGYFAALEVWTVISAGLYVLAAWGSLRETVAPPDRLSAGLLVVGFPAFFLVLLNGQVSTLAAAAIACAWLAWRRDSPLLCGMALGSLVFKPPLLTVAIAFSVAAPSLRMWSGVAAGVLLQIAAVALAGGVAIWRSYLDAAVRVLQRPGAFEPKPEQMQGLRGFFGLLLGPGAVTSGLYVAAGIATLVLGYRVLRQRPPAALGFSALVVCGLLLDPHLYTYDLVVLVVPLGLLAGWLNGRDAAGATRSIAQAAWALYWVPLVAPLSAALRVQVATPVMVWLLWTMGQGVPARSTDRRGSEPASLPAPDSGR